MNFINSYKHLEKLCGDMFDNIHGVSAYIEEMINMPSGSYLVQGWDDDLKQLKHYRWLRNQIVHEPDCYEEDMCGQDDVLWLDNFYNRIMNQSDPLALYQKSIRSKFEVSDPLALYQKSIRSKFEVKETSYSQQKNGKNKSYGLIIFPIIAAILLIFFILKTT